MQFPLGDVLARLRKKAAVFFRANLNKPPGTLAPLDVLKKALQAARDTVVVFDEACAEFSGLS
jgi:histidinol-phosphate/aromatic aminotransferase/cobyric acid decarboxylase-like protein